LTANLFPLQLAILTSLADMIFLIFVLGLL